jgi:cellulose synthase/poly-beta-1,6-N-acetylglucosamine synthase-like glycosyltransferase
MKGPLLDLTIKNCSQGSVLLMTDPDVIAEENWILDIVQPFKDREVGAVAGTVHCGNYHMGFIPLMRAIEDEWRLVAPMLRNSERVFSLGANQAIRREAWEQTKYGDDVLDDIFIINKIINKGWKCVGTSASGVEEEVEDLKQYWNQRVRWYKLNPNHFVINKWKKFIEALPHAIQLFALGLIVLFFCSLNDAPLIVLSLINFGLMNFAMMVAFFRIRTGKGFIPFIPLFLTVDTVLFAITAIYVQTLGRFIQFTKEVWPSLKGYYYHAGTKLKTEFFMVEQKVEQSFRDI